MNKEFSRRDRLQREQQQCVQTQGTTASSSIKMWETDGWDLTCFVHSVVSSVYRRFPFSIPSPAFIVCRFCWHGHSDCCEAIPYCSFHLHFSSNSWCWASFRVLFQPSVWHRPPVGVLLCSACHWPVAALSSKAPCVSQPVSPLVRRVLLSSSSPSRGAGSVSLPFFLSSYLVVQEFFLSF